MMRNRIFTVMLIVAAAGTNSFAQSPAPQAQESHRYRTILTTAGAGGGFGVGVFVGLSAFDDAKYANRKVWTTALVSAAAAGVAGYFVGRAVDKSRARSRRAPVPTTGAPDALDRSLLLHEAARKTAAGYSFPTLPAAPAPGKLVKE